MAPHHPSDNAVQTMVGLGPKSSQWLRDAGITYSSQVRTLGAVECYLRVIRLGSVHPNLNLLWALQGAIEDLHWTLVDPKKRKQIRAELERKLAQNPTTTEA